MSKSKKRKKHSSVSPAEQAMLQQEKADRKAAQTRHSLYAIGAIIILGGMLIVMLLAPFFKGTPAGYHFEQYERLRTGMTYEQVVKVLHNDGEVVSEEDGKTVYTWKNEDGSSITITFDGEEVSTFTQSGLEN